MSCTTPKIAWQQQFTCVTTRKRHQPIFRDPGKHAMLRPDSIWQRLELPCRRCPSCRLEYSRQWALRGACEFQMHDKSSFVTFTYAPRYLPKSGSLIKSHYQKLFKRMRKAGYEFSYMVAGEYGEKLGRPHYHAIFFGEDFKRDSVPSSFTRSAKMPLWENQKLTKLWGKGHVVIGSVSLASIRYVASYITNRFYGSEAALAQHYGKRLPEFMQPSLKNPIGKRWIEKYTSDVFPRDEFVHEGRKMKPPAYFFRWLQKKDPSLALDISFRRSQYMKENSHKFSIERALARESIMLSRFKNKMRNLDKELSYE